MSALLEGLSDRVAGEVAAVVEAVRRSVVLIDTGRGHGSGVIWERNGLIVTNHHVADRDRARVELADGRELEGRVVARDPANDLAAMRVSAPDLPAVPVGDSRSLRVGQLLLAIGNPFGVRGSATLGIVSARIDARRGWGSRFDFPTHAAHGHRREGDLLQADIALAPGSSGGPLVDASGAVVGIASMVCAPGVALAIPAETIRRFLAESSGVME